MIPPDSEKKTAAAEAASTRKIESKAKKAPSTLHKAETAPVAKAPAKPAEKAKRRALSGNQTKKTTKSNVKKATSRQARPNPVRHK